MSSTTVFGEKVDFGIVLRAIEHDLRGAECLAAMNKRDFAAEAAKEIGFFHRRIAAADHHDFFLAKEKAIAGSAGADAVADQLVLVGKTQPARRRAGRNDQCAGLDLLSVLEFEAEGRVRQDSRA